MERPPGCAEDQRGDLLPSFQQGTLPEKSPETKPGCGVDCTGVNRMGLGFYRSYCDAGLKCGLLRETHMTHVYLVISNRLHVKS